MLLDSSANTGSTEWRLIQRYLSDVVDLVVLGWDQVRMALVQYSRTTEIALYLDDYQRGDVYYKQVIRDLSRSADRDRRLDRALARAVDLLKPEFGGRQNADQFLLIVTTGKQTGTMDQYVADFRKRYPYALIYVLAFGSDFLGSTADANEVRNIVGYEPSRGQLWVISDYQYYDETVDQYALWLLRNRYFCPLSAERSKWTTRRRLTRSVFQAGRLPGVALAIIDVFVLFLPVCFSVADRLTVSRTH